MSKILRSAGAFTIRLISFLGSIIFIVGALMTQSDRGGEFMGYGVLCAALFVISIAPLEY